MPTGLIIPKPENQKSYYLNPKQVRQTHAAIEKQVPKSSKSEYKVVNYKVTIKDRQYFGKSQVRWF